MCGCECVWVCVWERKWLCESVCVGGSGCVCGWGRDRGWALVWGSGGVGVWGMIRERVVEVGRQRK